MQEFFSKNVFSLLYEKFIKVEMFVAENYLSVSYTILRLNVLIN